MRSTIVANSTVDVNKTHPVLVLHGLFGSGNNLRSLAKRLVEIIPAFSFHLVDLRNHGESPHSEGMSYDLMIQDVSAYIRKYKLAGVSVIGHSMGGRLAMLAALQNHSIFSKMVILDVAPVTYPPFDKFNSYIDILRGLDLSTTHSRKEADEYLQPLLPQFGLRQFLLTNLTIDIDGNFAWRVNLDAIKRALPDLRIFGSFSKAYPGPTLFIGGAESDYITEAYHPVMRKFFPNSNVIMVKGSGHWVHADKPDVVINLVSEFLGRDLKMSADSEAKISSTTASTASVQAAV